MADLTDAEEKCLKVLRKHVENHELYKGLDDFLTDEFLLAFVRGRKCNIEKARKSLHTFIKIRRIDYRDLFQQFIPSSIKHGFDVPVRVQGCLKNRDPKGRYVGIERIGIWNPEHIDPFKGGMLLLFYGMEAMKLVPFQREGVVIIIDAAHVSWKHVKYIDLSFVKMLSSVYIDSLPLRYREIHIVNQSVLVDMVLPMIKMFMSRKLRNRIQMHATLESLHEAVPREILPQSLGGPLTDEEAFDSKFEQRIVDSEEFYVKLAQKW